MIVSFIYQIDLFCTTKNWSISFFCRLMKRGRKEGQVQLLPLPQQSLWHGVITKSKVHIIHFLSTIISLSLSLSLCFFFSAQFLFGCTFFMYVFRAATCKCVAVFFVSPHFELPFSFTHTHTHTHTRYSQARTDKILLTGIFFFIFKFELFFFHPIFNFLSLSL